MVALDKVSINSHREVGGGILRIGRSVGEPVFIVSKALQELLSAWDAGHLRGRVKPETCRKGPHTISRMVGMSQRSWKANKVFETQFEGAFEVVAVGCSGIGWWVRMERCEEARARRKWLFPEAFVRAAPSENNSQLHRASRGFPANKWKFQSPERGMQNQKSHVHL